MNEAIASLHDFGWYLHMLWEDSYGWGATIRDALEGTCEHYATARGYTPEDAVQSAIEQMVDEAFDAPEITTAHAATSESFGAASGLLTALGLRKEIKRRKING